MRVKCLAFVCILHMTLREISIKSIQSLDISHKLGAVGSSLSLIERPSIKVMDRHMIVDYGIMTQDACMVQRLFTNEKWISCWQQLTSWQENASASSCSGACSLAVRHSGSYGLCRLPSPHTACCPRSIPFHAFRLLWPTFILTMRYRAGTPRGYVTDLPQLQQQFVQQRGQVHQTRV